MTVATANRRQIIPAVFVSALTLLAVVFLFWVSGARDDARADLAPDIVMNPVTLPDGTVLHVQRFELSVAEWNMCFDAGGCRQELRARGAWPEAETPATGLSYLDTQEFINWINTVSGQAYRLPTLQEWEFMASEVMPEEPEPIFTDPSLTWASAYLLEPQTARTLRPQGTFDVTDEGVADLNGSVWEWTQDCWHDNYQNAPDLQTGRDTRPKAGPRRPFAGTAPSLRPEHAPAT